MKIYDTLTVRPARRSDASAIAKVEKAAFVAAWGTEEVESLLARQGVRCVVAERGGRVVGFALWEKLRKAYRLRAVAVLPTDRRLGVGSSLLAAAMKTSGGKITAEVNDDNLPAHQFFRARGFFCTKIVRGGWSGGDSYLFQPTGA